MNNFDQLLHDHHRFNRPYLLNGISDFDQTKNILKKKLWRIVQYHYLIFINTVKMDHSQTINPPPLNTTSKFEMTVGDHVTLYSVAIQFAAFPLLVAAG